MFSKLVLSVVLYLIPDFFTLMRDWKSYIKDILLTILDYWKATPVGVDYLLGKINTAHFDFDIQCLVGEKNDDCNLSAPE